MKDTLNKNLQLEVMGKEIQRMRPKYSEAKTEITNKLNKPEHLDWVVFFTSEIKLFIKLIVRLIDNYESYKLLVEEIIPKKELELETIEENIKKLKPEYEEKLKETEEMLNRPDSAKLVCYQDSSFNSFIETIDELFNLYFTYQKITGKELTKVEKEEEEEEYTEI